MAYPIQMLFEGMGLDVQDVEALRGLCEEAGLMEAIDPAFLKEAEAVEVARGDSRLAGLLVEAGTRARPMMEAWKKRGPRAGGGGGEVPPGVVVEQVQRPQSSAFPAPGGTGLPNANVVRASRLLRSCTRNILKTKK